MEFNFNWSYINDGAAYVTIGSYGLAFNSASISLLDEPEQVMIGFDIGKMTIGVKRYQNEKNVKPYDFASRARNGWVRIGCKDFVKNLSQLSGIDFTSSKRYLAKYDQAQDLLYVIVDSVNEADSVNESMGGDE